MTTAEEAAAAHREREKELWSAIEDYKAGDVDHREVQVRIDRFASASDLVWAIEYAERPDPLVTIAGIPDALEEEFGG